MPIYGSHILNLSDVPGLPKNDIGPVFEEPWEAHAFAMAVKLNEAGVFEWSEWAAALSEELHLSPDRPYYEGWLVALERLVESKGVISLPERLERIEAWDRAAKATPHGKPIELSRLSPTTEIAR